VRTPSSTLPPGLFSPAPSAAAIFQGSSFINSASADRLLQTLTQLNTLRAVQPGSAAEAVLGMLMTHGRFTKGGG
jgi:hypothetical protein